jgi:Ca-activated chloride channel family protein
MKLKNISIVAIAFAVFFQLPLPVSAVNVQMGEEHELVILLDASNSMGGNDPNDFIKDSMKKLLYSLPSNYRVGFLSYNNTVKNQAAIATYKSRNTVSSQIDAVSYSGYTNAGAGLETAVQMFGEEQGISREIVFISDGEILMGSKAETDISSQKFDAALSLAVDKGISIYMIGLGNSFRSSGNSIVEAASRTGGVLHETSRAGEIPAITNQILFEDLGVKRIAVGMAKIKDAEGSLVVPLPTKNMQRASILMTSDSPIRDIAANLNGADVEIARGQRYAVITVEQPSSDHIDIKFQGATEVRADLIVEYEGNLSAEVAYTDKVIPATDKIPAYVDREAKIRLRLMDKNTAQNLLEDPYFSGKQVTVSTSGQTEQVPITDGYIAYTMPVHEDQSLDIGIDWRTFDSNVICPASISVELKAPEPLPVEEHFNYIPLIVILAALILVVIALLIRQKNESKKRKNPAETESYFSKYDYAGKLNLYITKTPDDVDIAPQTFPLYKLYSKKQISLGGVLQECGIQRPFPGTENILLISGKDKSLVVLNKSDATILLGSQIVIRNKTYPMHFGEKMHITCEDECTELEVHYRSVKPSEMR